MRRSGIPARAADVVAANVRLVMRQGQQRDQRLAQLDQLARAMEADAAV